MAPMPETEDRILATPRKLLLLACIAAAGFHLNRGHLMQREFFSFVLTLALMCLAMYAVMTFRADKR